MLSDDNKIRVLSLNCWGLKYVSKNLDERIEAIAHQLSTATYDIIALQELWVFAHYERVRNRVSKNLPHSKFFYSGALGSGLAIFSRYPIISAAIHPYALNGTPIDVAGGDWFVGKAAAYVVIHHPALGQVQVFNTHLYAKGGEDGPEHNRAHRLVNAWQFAKLARTAAETGKYVIALGDFNSAPHTLPITVMLEHAGLKDAWTVTHPPINTAAVASAEDAIERLGITADSPVNSWTRGKLYARGTWGKRLDYILYRQPNRPGPKLEAVDSKVVFTELVPSTSFSHSDHFGLETTFEISENASPSTLPSKELSIETITTTVHALAACYRFSKERSKKELYIFALCIVLLIGLLVASSWLPRTWINPIFVLFTIFISWLGTTMLYEGFIFGNWECNALMNVIDELEIHSKGLDIIRRGSLSS
ncbi:hypothetical protein D9619_002631 [Psilocybe cf. subviscida]|uniref:Endonuclease/exonuclease/phosphatase domain-containing protein n=1 Tax=Psilocybe cf. subviscida TaxID=2480587 RepID=A0A8H5AYH4_9AGAR|nr:hypothetical protein D9619_002631 [Psilocybe cf. subviscida]